MWVWEAVAYAHAAILSGHTGFLAQALSICYDNTQIHIQHVIQTYVYLTYLCYNFISIHSIIQFVVTTKLQSQKVNYHIKHILVEENLGKSGQHWWFTNFNHLNFNNVSWHKQRKQTNRNLPKFYLPKVSDGKLAKVSLHQTLALYCILWLLLYCNTACQYLPFMVICMYIHM